MAGSILGNAVPRLGDPDLLRGRATYIDNLDWPAKAYLHLVRSTVAHAAIRSIDTSAAAAAPGVLGCCTAADLDLLHQVFVPVADCFARPPLARDVVRFVGDPVVAIVAEDAAAAADAADLVVVDYDPLPVIVDPERAFDEGQPVVHPDHGSNVAFSNVDPYDDDFFADADVVVRGRFENQRMAVVPMEPNAFAAIPPAAADDGRLTVYASTQMPHLLEPVIRQLFGLAEGQVRVIAPHVGGGFGGKAGMSPEYTTTIACALRLGRPVTWTETRSEDLVGLPHSRAQVQYVELGCRRDGTFTGLRARIVGDSGAYPGIGTLLPGGTRRMSQAVYDLPKVSVDIACAVTNTTPTGAFRGAGRPEAASMVERIVDQAALELGIDPVEIRRRNFLQPDAFPYTVRHAEITYDSGDYERPLAEVLRRAGYEELRADQARRREAGDRRVLGIGLSTYVEITAGGGSAEFGAVSIEEDGSATIRVGTSAHGQGHATSFAMIVQDKLGIPLERVAFVQSDTDLVPRRGTGGSRSLQLGGSAVAKAADTVLDQARRLAAELLEANVDDIVVIDGPGDGGRLGVVGVPARALTWAELARAAADRAPAGDPAPLAAELDFDQGGATFPFGAHIAVVEVDLDTGHVDLLRHVAVDDAGTVINPLILAGQQHGGVATGIAQALYEIYRYDEDGNPRTANLADYLMPSAAEMPSFEVFSTETPTPLNPLGAKGIGEAGTIGATPAVQNAVIDAVAHLGIRHLDMPLTPESVWRAIEAARAGEPPDPWRDPPTIFDRLRSGAAAAAASDTSVEAAESI